MFFFQQNKFFGFPWCSTREELSIDVSITNVGLILTKQGRFLFSGYGQTLGVRTDRHSGYGQTDTVFLDPHMEHFGTQKISTQSS